MTYANWYTIWNKLVRDNVVSDLQKQGIKVTYTTIASQQQLFILLGRKLEKELEELNEAVTSNKFDKILVEAADVQTVSNKLHTMIWTDAAQSTESYFRIIENLWQAEWKINKYIKQSWHDHLQKMNHILQKKLQTKWWFNDWIFLISTEW